MTRPTRAGTTLWQKTVPNYESDLANKSRDSQMAWGWSFVNQI